MTDKPEVFTVQDSQELQGLTYEIQGTTSEMMDHEAKIHSLESQVAGLKAQMAQAAYQMQRVYNNIQEQCPQLGLDSPDANGDITSAYQPAYEKALQS